MHDEMVRSFPGQTSTVQEVDLSFRVPGQLEEFPVSVGQFVEQGDLIARLDPRDYELAVRQAQQGVQAVRAQLRALERGAREEDIAALEAQLEGAQSALEEAESQYQRFRQLYEEQVIPRAQYEQVETARDAARAQVTALEQGLLRARRGGREEEIDALTAQVEALEAQRQTAESAMEDTRLRAPFSGYITFKYVNNYMTINAGLPIVRIQDLSQLEIQIGLPEGLITQMEHVASSVSRLDVYPDREFEVRITQIGPSASLMTRTFPVTVAMDQPTDIQVLPGMAAEVTLTFRPPEDRAVGFEVPATALFTGPEDRWSVWVIDRKENTVGLRTVTVGQLTADGVIVTVGLEEGEWIVTAGVHFLQEGQEIQILDPEASWRGGRR